MLKYMWYKFIKKLGGNGVRNSRIGFDSKIEAGSVLVNSTMGKYSFCGYDCVISNCDIGSFVSIADRVYIGRGVHPINWVSTSPVFYNNRDSVKTKFSLYNRDEHPRTYIGNDVWIGDGVYIKAGVKIGNGAIIGMGSVVTKDVEPYSIVVGVPAKEIRKRFTDEVCKGLEETEWWNYSTEQLRELAKYIREPEEFLRYTIKMSERQE